MRSRRGTQNVVVYVLSLVLIVAVAGGGVLVALQLRGDAPIHFDVSPAQGGECPSGVGTPACFRFAVTNVGNRASLVRCDVSAEAGHLATFLTDSPIYVSAAPFEPGIPEELWVKVDAGDDDVVTAPALVCAAV
jgi:hypothetical protein